MTSKCPSRVCRTKSPMSPRCKTKRRANCHRIRTRVKWASRIEFSRRKWQTRWKIKNKRMRLRKKGKIKKRYRKHRISNRWWRSNCPTLWPILQQVTISDSLGMPAVCTRGGWDTATCFSMGRRMMKRAHSRSKTRSSTTTPFWS